MEGQDLEGAAASLCVYRLLTPTQAIETTLLFVDRMNIEPTFFEPEMLDLLRNQSPMAHWKVNERAIAMAREKAKKTWMKHSNLSVEEVSESMAQFEQSLLATPPKHQQQSEPDRIPKKKGALSDSPRANAVPPSLGVPRRLPLEWFQRIGKWAALVYGAMTIGGLAILLYSYVLSPPAFRPLALSKDAVPEEQAMAIQQWSKSNLPANVRWFFPIENYISMRLEPGLPSDFAFLDLEWEKKLEHLNQTAKGALAAFHRCHIQLLLFYGLGFVCAVWFYLRLDLVAGGLMTLIGLLGIRSLTVGWLRLEWENSYWLGPLLVPGIAAVTVAMMTLAVSPADTDRQKELKGFWLGACVFLITSIALGMAIANGGSFRANAGVGVLGGLLLMLRHGTRLLLRSFHDRPSISS